MSATLEKIGSPEAVTVIVCAPEKENRAMVNGRMERWRGLCFYVINGEYGNEERQYDDVVQVIRTIGGIIHQVIVLLSDETVMRDNYETWGEVRKSVNNAVGHLIFKNQ